MLVMPTERGYAAAINFSTEDGTLSQIAKSEPKSILQKTEDVLLPVDTLDNIKIISKRSVKILCLKWIGRIGRTLGSAARRGSRQL